MSSPLRVMVTAGASGIGAAIASRFTAEGAVVSVLDSDPAAVEESRARGVHSIVGDVSDATIVDAWFDDRLAAWSGLDVLINNAGVAGPTAYVEDVSVDAWRTTMAVGIDSHFLTSRRAAAVMKLQGAGSIVAISSTAGLYGYGMRTPYAAAKWAVIGLVKSLAVELGPHGVRVNAICPGSVDGPRMRRVIEAEARARGVDQFEVERQYAQGQSIHRFVEAREIADMAWFLASPAASMVNGQAIAVDGHTETFHL